MSQYGPYGTPPALVNPLDPLVQPPRRKFGQPIDRAGIAYLVQRLTTFGIAPLPPDPAWGPPPGAFPTAPQPPQQPGQEQQPQGPFLQVVWMDDAQGQLGERLPGTMAWIKLAITGFKAKGDLEYRQQTDPNIASGNVLESTLVGYGTFTLSIRCDSLDADAQPYDILERVRVGLRTKTAAALFHRSGVAFVRAGDIHVYRQPNNNRTQMGGNLDVVFSTLRGFTITDDPGQTIATVDGISIAGGASADGGGVIEETEPSGPPSGTNTWPNPNPTESDTD